MGLDGFAELTLEARDLGHLESFYGISEFDHAWLQRRSQDVEVCLAYLREHSIAFTLAQPAECPSGAGAFTETPRCETLWEFLTYVRRSAILDDGCGGLRSSQGSFSSRQASMPPPRWDRAA